MSATIIDGKERAAALRAQVAQAVPRFTERTGRAPGLAVVLVGEDPASQVYVRSKGRQTIEAGMESFSFTLDASTTQEELLALVRRLNTDDAVDGILVQLPLPSQIDEHAVLAARFGGGFRRRLFGRLCRGFCGRPLGRFGGGLACGTGGGFRRWLHRRTSGWGDRCRVVVIVATADGEQYQCNDRQHCNEATNRSK